MTSAWGKSWGSAWGNAWGSVSVEQPPVLVLNSSQLSPFLFGLPKPAPKRVTAYGYSTGGNYARATAQPRALVAALSSQLLTAAAHAIAHLSVALLAENKTTAHAYAFALSGQQQAARLASANNQLLSLALRSRLSVSPIVRNKLPANYRTEKQQKTEANNQLILLAITAYYLRKNP